MRRARSLLLWEECAIVVPTGRIMGQAVLQFFHDLSAWRYRVYRFVQPQPKTGRINTQTKQKYRNIQVLRHSVYHGYGQIDHHDNPPAFVAG